VSFWVLGHAERGRCMSKSNHSEAQMIGALKQLEAGTKSGGRGARGGGVQAHHLRLESEVRGHGCKRGAGSQATAGREHAVKETGGGSESGQGDAEGGDRKKRMELVDQRSEASWLGLGYVVSERRVCGLMGMAVSSYRYRGRRCDDELRGRLVELAAREAALWVSGIA